MAGTKEGAAKAAQKRRDKARERRETREALLGALVSVGGRPASPDRLRPAPASVASVQRLTDEGAGGASVVTDGRPMERPMTTDATDGATDEKTARGTAEQPVGLLPQSEQSAVPEGAGAGGGLDMGSDVSAVTVEGGMHPVDQVIDAAAYEAAWLLRKTIASGKASLSLRIDAAKKALELRQRRLEAAQKPGAVDGQGGNALAALAAALGPVMARRQAVASAVTVEVLPQPDASPSVNSQQQPDS